MLAERAVVAAKPRFRREVRGERRWVILAYPLPLPKRRGVLTPYSALCIYRLLGKYAETGTTTGLWAMGDGEHPTDFLSRDCHVSVEINDKFVSHSLSKVAYYFPLKGILGI